VGRRACLNAVEKILDLIGTRTPTPQSSSPYAAPIPTAIPQPLNSGVCYGNTKAEYHERTKNKTKKKTQTPWSESASELYRLSDRRLSASLVPIFAGVAQSARRIPYGRNLGFLDRSRYFFFQVATLTRLSGPRSRPTISQKMWKRRESKPDLWICSQKL
jgi:hypothetical protein